MTFCWSCRKSRKKKTAKNLVNLNVFTCTRQYQSRPSSPAIYQQQSMKRLLSTTRTFATLTGVYILKLSAVLFLIP